MPSYKLTYFDFDGGRGEPIRIALHAAGIAFEDNRLNFEQFGAMRQSMPFNAVPVLEIDGVAVTQSNAICRFVGKQAGLYPTDAMQALYCDEVMGVQEDLTHYIVATFGLEGEALRAARDKLVKGRMSVYLRGIEKLLARGGGKYFADGALTVADLKAFVNTRWLRSGALDHVPNELVQQLAPGLVEHQQRVEKDPVVVGWYDSRP